MNLLDKALKREKAVLGQAPVKCETITCPGCGGTITDDSGEWRAADETSETGAADPDQQDATGDIEDRQLTPAERSAYVKALLSKRKRHNSQPTIF